MKYTVWFRGPQNSFWFSIPAGIRQVIIFVSDFQLTVWELMNFLNDPQASSVFHQVNYSCNHYRKLNTYYTSSVTIKMKYNVEQKVRSIERDNDLVLSCIPKVHFLQMMTYYFYCCTNLWSLCMLLRNTSGIFPVINCQLIHLQVVLFR